MDVKQAFTSAPILVHVDLEKKFIIEAYASDFARGSALSQIAHGEKFHPIASHSRKLKLVEINYEIHKTCFLFHLHILITVLCLLSILRMLMSYC